MNDDDLDQRVRTYGSGWRDAHPFPADIDTSRLGGGSRRKTAAAVVAAVAVVAAALGLAAALRHDGPATANRVVPSSTLPSPTTTTTTVPRAPTTVPPAPIPAPQLPSEQVSVPLDRPNAPLAFGNGRVWVGTSTGLAAFDPVTLRRVAEMNTVLPVLELASTSDGVWVLSGNDENLEPAGNPPYRLERIDPTTLHVEFSKDLPYEVGYRSHEHVRLAAAPGVAWVALATTVLRVDARTGAVTPISLSGHYEGNIAADDSGLWVECEGTDGSAVKDAPLVHIDAATNAVATVPGLPNGFYWSVATTGDAAWLVAAVDSGSSLELTRIDAVTYARTTYRIPGIALVAGAGQLWVQVIPPTGGSSLNYHSLVGQIDTATGKFSRTITISIGEEPGSSGDGYPQPPFVVANGQIWSAYNGLQRTTLRAH